MTSISHRCIPSNSIKFSSAQGYLIEDTAGIIAALERATGSTLADTCDPLSVAIVDTLVPLIYQTVNYGWKLTWFYEAQGRLDEFKDVSFADIPKLDWIAAYQHHHHEDCASQHDLLTMATLAVQIGIYLRIIHQATIDNGDPLPPATYQDVHPLAGDHFHTHNQRLIAIMRAELYAYQKNKPYPFEVPPALKWKPISQFL